MYIHSNESGSNSCKALQFREWYPGIVTPAPALTLEPLASLPKPSPVSVPTVLIHGTLDTGVPLGPVRLLAEQLFTNLSIYIVADDHRPHKTANEMDWKSSLA